MAHGVECSKFLVCTALDSARGAHKARPNLLLAWGRRCTLLVPRP